MKCPNCNGQRYKAPDVPCGRCGGNGVVEPLTNEEYIRTCSTEELAKLIYKIAVTDVLMDRFFTAEIVNAGIVDVDSGIKEAKAWLKEKHE
jgi:hypothetical protein